MSIEQLPLINRELSWLSFNERVLQEALDTSNPVLERLRFLGIFSNNRDEFFRVRVATVKRMTDLGKQARMQLYDDPEEVLDEIKAVILKQEKLFDKAFKNILADLKKVNIHFVNEKQLDEEQMSFVSNYFKDQVRSTLVPLMLDGKNKTELADKASYLAIKLYNKEGSDDVAYALIEIPRVLDRFLILPSDGNKKYVMFLDDVIRIGLPQVFKIFDYKKIEAYAIKLTRDAELDIDEDIDESVIEKLSKGLDRRKKAEPVRFIHDQKIPEDFLDFLLNTLRIKKKQDIIASGRYHNFKDFIKFPSIGGKNLNFGKLKPLRHPALNNKRSLLNAITEKDVLLNYPYQTFSHTIDILREAAIDPTVTEIQINIYRIASNSKVANALINASKNGKAVTVIVELRARFDEESNIYWSKKLQENGVRVIFGVDGLKVHSKLILITRKTGNSTKYITHIGTGNFHEGTANVYTDMSLWTANDVLAKEVSKLFVFFRNNYKHGNYRELIVSPFNVRRKLNKLIDKEISNAEKGKDAEIILKLNNLVDLELIKKLYKASQAGVKIRIIIRGICSLVPGVKGISENIKAISILDRYLEHARIMIFHNSGDPKYFLCSADWMGRNLDQRIEVTTPVYDDDIKQEIQDVIDIQWSDNQKARIIDAEQSNKYRPVKGKKIRSQIAIRNYYKAKFQ